jgi:hypothetical protein
MENGHEVVVSTSQTAGAFELPFIYQDHSGSVFSCPDGRTATGGAGTQNQDIRLNPSTQIITVRRHFQVPPAEFLATKRPARMTL